MGKNKPRHNPDKPQNHFAEHCPYDDGTKWKECNNEWADKCDGNRYRCYKLYLQHLATLSEKKKQEYAEMYERNHILNGAPRTNC